MSLNVGQPLFINVTDGAAPVAPVGVPFVTYKTGMSLLSGGNGATIFAISLPAGASGFRVMAGWFEVTAVTAGVAAAFRFNIAGNNGIMTGSTASSSATPVVGQQWETGIPPNTSPTFKATSGNVTVTISVAFTGTTVTATMFLLGCYVP